ncbi:MAG: DMT family transporter [Candidatus Liptonbacteria bacterium]
MAISQERKGEFFILGQVWLWGLFPVVVTMTYFSLPPLVSLAFSTAIAVIVFAIMMSWNHRWSELKNVLVLKDIFVVALLNGVLYYCLYFWGLKNSNSGNVSLVSLMEIFFSYLLFQVWKREYFSAKHLWGAILMLVGAVTILFPKSSGWHIGDLFVLAASAVGPVGNYFQKRARAKVSSETILLVRGIISAPTILLLSFYFGESFVRGDVYRSIWDLALIGFVMFGLSKIMWLEGIHRLPITKAVALSSINPLFTLLFAYALLGDIPTVWQLSSFVPLFFGLLLLTSKNPEKEFSLEP